MLMDPLVSALNGSQTLVSQGLRTLELCVDNLQPDFLYDHIQPVRAELFQVYYKPVPIYLITCTPRGKGRIQSTCNSNIIT